MNLWTFIRSHVIKHISRFYLQYNDKWYNILLFRISTFIFHYSFFRIGIRYCFYSSSSLRGFVIWLHKGWIRPSLIYPLISRRIKFCLEYKNKEAKIPCTCQSAVVPFSFNMDYISIDISSLYSSELVSYCNTIIINIIIVLVLACLINLMLILLSGMWTPLQINQIKQSMLENIPEQKRRDPLYIKLAYQYASNNFTNQVLPYNSPLWVLHSASRDYPKLTMLEEIRVTRAVRSGISNLDPDSFEYGVNTRRVFFAGDPAKSTPPSTPQFIRLINRYDEG